MFIKNTNYLNRTFYKNQKLSPRKLIKEHKVYKYNLCKCKIPEGSSKSKNTTR